MNYCTYDDLLNDTKKLVKTIPNNFAGIISIPRSGNIPANIVALHFNVPLYTINEFTNDIDVTTFTQRLSENNTGSKYLVVDDSINTGERIVQAKKELNKFDLEFEYLCVYARDENVTKYINYYSKIIPQPRVFEWNIFNHSILSNSCLDIDGVICPDPPMGTIDEVRDEQGYINFIKNATPINHIKVPIKAFVTSRMEKYRGVTEEWLKKHGFQYDKLYMCQYKNAIERRRLNRYGDDKARIYHETKSALMIESSSWQAQRIFQLTKKPVLCTDTNRMFK